MTITPDPLTPHHAAGGLLHRATQIPLCDTIDTIFPSYAKKAPPLYFGELPKRVSMVSQSTRLSHSLEGIVQATALRPSTHLGKCLGSSGSARIPACCSRHLAANVSQRMTSGPTDVEMLIAAGRKQMLSAFPPDHPLWRHPGSPSTSWPLPLGWALWAFQAQIL